MIEMNTKLKDLVNNLEIGIFRYSLDSRGKFVFANAAFSRMLNKKTEDVLGISFQDICENPEELTRLNTKICSQGRVENEWIGLKREDGSLIQCSIKAVLVKDDNEKDLLIDGIIEDITEHKKAREGLLQAKLAAEEASSAKSMFLANMSHEVRTPMNAVIGMLDLTLETDLTDDQKDNIETAKEAADNLLSLLNDILDISRVEAGKIVLEKVKFDLWKVTDSVGKGLSVLANKKNIQLTVNVDPKVPRMIVGDSTRLRQIIINLLNNAIKFTAKGSVELKVGVASSLEGEVELLFSVTDTGIGIPKDKQQAIFEVFTQADASTTRKFGGTGLGLAISRKLVEMMSGKIWIESEEGVGSTFFFTARFDVSDQLQTQDEKEHKKVFVQGKEPVTKAARILNILLAEDNPLNQKIAVKLLEKKGWLVEVVDNGQKAIDHIVDKNFDVILMDVQMPVLDGLEATKKIREQEKQTGKHIPILAMTARAMVEDEKKCIESGMDGYIPKPIDAVKMYSIIEQVLEKG
ncbi:MAG: ATP-binding protein [Candidatus Omnitrophica bacterium]|nr:ATP-binding protein [Candidatus Omnitrophota bacterium]